MSNTEPKTLDFMNDIARKAINQHAGIIDQAAFAYIVKQFDYLLSIGEDPREYEVVLQRMNGIRMTDDGYEIDTRLRLLKIVEDDAKV